MPDPTDRLSRILTMIPYIREHPGIRVADLAAYVGCGPDDIIADINAILLCGVPPYMPNDYINIVIEHDRIHIAFAEHFQRPVNLTLEEALALGLALDRLPLSRRSRGAAQALRRRIAAVLPRSARREWRSAARRLQVGPALRAVRQRIALLEQAIEERREARIEYYTASRDEMTDRVIRPYGIIEHEGEWYVVGHCCLRDRELPFRVDRIRKVELLDAAFAVPASFNLENYRRPTMYFPTSRDLRVKLKIAPELARWIRNERPLGAMRDLPDGGLILHLSVSQPQWIISWILSHAGQVELLAPEALRRMVAEACAKTLEKYSV